MHAPNVPKLVNNTHSHVTHTSLIIKPTRIKYPTVFCLRQGPDSVHDLPVNWQVKRVTIEGMLVLLFAYSSSSQAFLKHLLSQRPRIPERLCQNKNKMKFHLSTSVADCNYCRCRFFVLLTWENLYKFNELNCNVRHVWQKNKKKKKIIADIKFSIDNINWSDNFSKFEKNKQPTKLNTKLPTSKTNWDFFKSLKLFEFSVEIQFSRSINLRSSRLQKKCQRPWNNEVISLHLSDPTAETFAISTGDAARKKCMSDKTKKENKGEGSRCTCPEDRSICRLFLSRLLRMRDRERESEKDQEIGRKIIRQVFSFLVGQKRIILGNLCRKFVTGRATLVRSHHVVPCSS